MTFSTNGTNLPQTNKNRLFKGSARAKTNFTINNLKLSPKMKL